VLAVKQREALVQELLLSRVEKRAPRLPEVSNLFPGAELNLRWHAWDNAKALGLMRHMKPDQQLILSKLYGGLQRVQSIQDARLVGAYHGANVLTIAGKNVALLQEISIDRLVELQASLGELRHDREFAAEMHREVPKEIDDVLGKL